MLLFYLALCLLSLAAFIHNGVIMLDPDFGWHLRMGQLIMTQGIPATDPFSYTMPSFPFIDHEWGSNVFIAFLYPKIGQEGLAVVFGIIAFASFAIHVSKRDKFFAPFLLSIAILLSFVWVRPQVVTWFFFSILVWLLLRPKLFMRWRFAFPLLFCLWVNLHGGFAAGIVGFAVFIFVSMWEKRKVDWSNVIVLFFCIVATCVNPYGARIWQEIWMQISDTSLRWTIAEWRSTLFVFNWAFVCLIPLSLLLVFRYRAKFSLAFLALYSGLLLAMISSLRHLPLWVILALPITSQSLGYLSQEAARKGGKTRFAKISMGLLGISICILVVNLYFDFSEIAQFREETFYPVGAVQFLKSHKTQNNILSGYNWGGYLIWKLPEKKVFVDGRMASWRWKSPNSDESDYAFREYNDVLEGKKPLRDITEKYSIDTLLLSTSSFSEEYSFLAKLDTFVNQILQKPARKYPSIAIQLRQQQFQLIYADSVALIYRKD